MQHLTGRTSPHLVSEEFPTNSERNSTILGRRPNFQKFRFQSGSSLAQSLLAIQDFTAGQDLTAAQDLAAAQDLTAP